jgi:hypothetical protein
MWLMQPRAGRLVLTVLERLVLGIGARSGTDPSFSISPSCFITSAFPDYRRHQRIYSDKADLISPPSNGDALAHLAPLPHHSFGSLDAFPQVLARLLQFLTQFYLLGSAIAQPFKRADSLAQGLLRDVTRRFKILGLVVKAQLPVLYRSGLDQDVCEPLGVATVAFVHLHAQGRSRQLQV